MVKKEKLFITELGKKSLNKIDFGDTFSITNSSNSIEEIAKLIFGKFPVWIRILFNLRNKLVKLIGLKPSIPEDYNTIYKVGGYIGCR